VLQPIVAGAAENDTFQWSSDHNGFWAKHHNFLDSCVKCTRKYNFSTNI